MKNFCAAMLLLMLSTVAASLGAQSAPTPAVDNADRAFMQQAGESALADVELSQLAVAQAGSADVKQFAQKTIDACSADYKELESIAAQQNIPLPSILDGEHSQLRDKLAELHSAEFDQVYVEAMRKDQQKMLDLLQSSQATVRQSDLRAFIAKSLPLTQQRLQAVQGIKL